MYFSAFGIYGLAARDKWLLTPGVWTDLWYWIDSKTWIDSL